MRSAVSSFALTGLHAGALGLRTGALSGLLRVARSCVVMAMAVVEEREKVAVVVVVVVAMGKVAERN